jgi:hypothetical protein
MGIREKTTMHIEKSNRKKLHQDWRTWLIVGLMLMAVGMYVLTLDDSIVPVSQSGGSQVSTAAPKP